MGANFTPEQEDYKKIGAFKFFCIQNFPFIADDFDQMTYYELICKLAEYIKKLIANDKALINNQESLLNAFIELQDYVNTYFDDLNIQEQVNNKLDEMVESGYFDNLLNNFINLIRIYDTTEAMLSDYENILVGQKIRTLGYYSINDGGGADFIITDNSSETFYQLTLDTNKYAQIVENDEVINLKKYGLKNVENFDNLSIIQNINDFYHNKTLFIPDGVYEISDTLFICNDNNLLMAENCELKASQAMNYMLVYNKENIGGYRTFGKFIRGGRLNGNYNVNVAVLSLQGILGFYAENIKILNFNLYGIKTHYENGNVNEAFFNNIYIRNDTPILNTIGIYNNSNDCKFSNIIIRDVHNGILTQAGYFDYVHGWNGFKALVPNSYFIKSISAEVILNNCYADTYQYSFISTFQSLNITNAFIYNNANIYDTDLQESYPPILFKAEQDIWGTNQWGYFKVVNSQIYTSNFETVELTNRYNVNNIFKDNWFSLYGKVTNKKFLNSSTAGVTLNLDVNTLVEPGVYGMSNNDNLPGSFKYGVLEVNTICTNKGAYITSADTSALVYCEQTFTSSEATPKIYKRIYSNNAWSDWIKITTTSV